LRWASKQQKKAPQFAVLFKITMDRQGKSTGIKSSIRNRRIKKLQTQHHDHKPKAFRKSANSLTNLKTFRSGSGSAATIGICWWFLNGQIIMPRIKNSNT
jgi:hypothetical protein